MAIGTSKQEHAVIEHKTTPTANLVLYHGSREIGHFRVRNKTQMHSTKELSHCLPNHDTYVDIARKGEAIKALTEIDESLLPRTRLSPETIGKVSERSGRRGGHIKASPWDFIRTLRSHGL